MRGSDRRSGELFSYVDVETRIRAAHPLRTIKAIVDEALASLSAEFDALYAARAGRPSIPPEMLLRAMLLQAFYSIRSERQLMERLEFDLLFRWFVGLSADAPAWDHSTFSKNRDRLLEGEVAARFLATVLAHGRVKRLLSTQHFSADGTLIEAWASLKSSSRRRITLIQARRSAGRRVGRRDGAQRGCRLQGRQALERDPSLDDRSGGDCSTARGWAWRRSSASSATGSWKTAPD